MAPQRKAVLIIAVGGTLCLFGLLSFLSLRKESSRARVSTPVAISTKPRESTPTVSLNPGIPGSTSSRQIIDQGHVYGRNAEWQKAFECWRQVVTSTPANEYEWSYATAAAVAAGETNAAEQLCVKMMQLYGKVNSSSTAERCAKQCLVLPVCSEELLDQAVERAEFTIRRDQNNRCGQLVKALAEYRVENYSSALDWLRQPQLSGELEISLQAWCVSVMARHQLSDAAGARKALEEVDRRVKVLVQTGELGRLRDNTWDSIARGMALRAEAEKLIFGKTVSAPLNTAELLQNRQKWQSVAWALNAGDVMGKQAQWVPAAEHYNKALQDPAFDWTVSEIKRDLQAQKMAAAFLMAGDQTHYVELVRVLLGRKLENLTPLVQERYAQIFVLSADLPPELKTQGLAYARRVCEFPDAETNPWICLLRGAIEYREGQFEKTIAALSQLFFKPTESDGAARAMAYKAMACKRLGRSNEALEATQEANALFAKQASRSGDWTNPSFHQLAMKELLVLLAEPNKAQ